MGYYADVGGYIVFSRGLSTDEIVRLDAMMDEAGWETYEHDETDVPDVAFWSGEKYYSETETLLDEIARTFPVKSGCVECHGEDGEHWKYEYVDDPNVGRFKYLVGHIVYTDPCPCQGDGSPDNFS